MTETQAKTAFSDADIKRFRENLKDEVDGAALYRMLADAEKDPHLKEVYSRLAVSEDRHLALWRSKLEEAGAEVPNYKPSMRVKMLGWLARRLGTQSVSPVVTRMEMSAISMYDNQPEAVDANLPADERSHARLFREISRSGTAASEGVNIARIEGRHRGGTGNALRAAVLGINDGLVSTLSLVMGVAGASPGRSVVFLSGIAGLLAGSLSMALGEWISVRSSAESFERQLRVEAEELEIMPEEEQEELTLIYQAKGFTREEAAQAARRILANKETALDTLAREELGMSAEEVGSAWVAGTTSFLLFSTGAILPVLPWMFVGGAIAVALSAIVAGLGLFVAGAFTHLFTGRGLLFSGMRMLAFGLAAAAVTFAIGRVIGVSTGV
ncbi:MAG: VIT1/CCC1 family protein [Dehalococcoidia bacterium]|nr:VIT1/CCC1 family protein [Dehalococcoidia bacterium]